MDTKEAGKLGGKLSAESRFKGKTKKQISELMKQVRSGKKIYGQNTNT